MHDNSRLGLIAELGEQRISTLDRSFSFQTTVRTFHPDISFRRKTIVLGLVQTYVKWFVCTDF
jgi:hypothetical protein